MQHNSFSAAVSTTAEAIATKRIQWFRRRLQGWAQSHRRDFPWRRTSDPYAIFVAEFMLQKTAAATVVPIYETFLAQYPSAIALAAASVEDLTELLQPLGLSFRAQRLHQSAQIICQEYGGQIPRQESELLKLPGVGPYTARSICANAFCEPKAVLDTNVARILERFFNIEGGRVKFRSPLLQKVATLVAPKRDVGAWNLGLLDFAAAVCTARNPQCDECPLRQQCAYPQGEKSARCG